MTLLAAITELQTTIKDIDGIRTAPTIAPDDISVYPFVVAYPSAGTVKLGPVGSYTALHDIVVELHGTRKDLPRDLRRIYPYSNGIPDAIYQAHKDGDYSTIKAVSADIEQETAPMSWGGVETLGIRYTIRGAKIQAAVSTNATAATGNEDIAGVCKSMQQAIRQDHSSIRRSPQYPSETFSSFPFVVTYPATATSVLEYGATSRTAYNLNTELHVSTSKGLARSLTQAIGYVDTIPQTMLLADFTKNMRHRGNVSYTFGWLQWGVVDTLGWRFTLADVVTETMLI